MAIPVVYRFFAANLFVFCLLLRSGVAHGLAARAFFVWVSVYNLFVVSVLWSFMADIWDSGQARRLFGLVAAGLSLGALAGPALAGLVVSWTGVPALLLLSAAFLEVAARCARHLGRQARTGSPDPSGAALGGGPFAGFAEVLRSRYLLALAAHQLLVCLSATFVYFQQARLVAALVHDPVARTRLFASVDLAVNLSSLALQTVATGPILSGPGLGFALVLHPLVAAVGLLAVAARPSLALVTAVQGLRRALHYGVERAAREVLFTVVPREEKYAAGTRSLSGAGAGCLAANRSSRPAVSRWDAIQPLEATARTQRCARRSIPRHR